MYLGDELVLDALVDYFPEERLIQPQFHYACTPAHPDFEQIREVWSREYAKAVEELV